MAKLSEYEKRRRKATKIQTWSTEHTILPDAFLETVAQYSAMNPDRVIAFNFKVWLKSPKSPREPR